MKTKLLTILLMLLSLTAFTQNDLKARIEFEEAETAFAAEDYNKAIIHLTEAEKLLGKWTPKVGYLMIVSFSKTLDYENLDTKQIETLNKQLKQYMQFASTNKNIDIEKFKEINSIEKEINSVKLAFEYYNKKDYENAMLFFKKAAEKGNDVAMNRIGLLYDNGQGVTKNYTEAINWYKRAAEKGNAIAMNNIGLSYNYGEGVKKDYTEAINWYKKAYETGYKEVKNNIAELYEKGGYSLEKNKELAKEWRNK